MDDTWFESDITREDLHSFLQALSLHAAQRPPLLAAAIGQDGAAHLVLASRPLFALFNVTSAESLSARLLQGADPGAKRLAVLCKTLPLEGAPRLERLRFFLGPGSEIITFLCRRMAVRGQSVFIAAALGVRAGLLPAAAQRRDHLDQTAPGVTPPEPVTQTPGPEAAPEPVAVTPVAETPAAPRDAAALQADLRHRWPAARTLRFLWHTDADAVCTLITPPLADVVGPGTADLVGHNMLTLAPQLDPSGRLATRLAGRETWSGLDLQWPLTDAAATIMVTAGAIPAFDHDKVFEGFRGFGMIHLDRLSDAAPATFGKPAPKPSAVNVVAFPGPGRPLSSDEQVAFRQIGETLRQQAPSEVAPAPEPAPPCPVEPQIVEDAQNGEAALPAPASPPAVAPDPGAATASAEQPAPVLEAALVAAAGEAVTDGAAAPPSGATREAEIGRNGLAVLDKLAIGLLVSRNNIPIFANRHLLDLLGFPDEDTLHEAGGMTHLFGGLPGNATGSEAVGIRGRNGTIMSVNARMQAIDWDGLPATLLTLRPNPVGPSAPLAKPEERPKPEDKAKSEDKTKSDEAKRQQDGELRELRAILETATDGVAVLDADCNVLSLNRSGEALFGCDRSEVIGKPFLGLFAPHNQSLAADYCEGLKSNATKSLLNDGRELLIKAHQGGTIPVFMTMGRLGPSAAASDVPQGARFCALFRDLTHWKKAEQELHLARQDAERASALKSDFLAKVSHEIRTPLNAIIGFAEVIMDERFGPVGNQRYKDYLKDIHSSGTHVMSLVNDLLDLSKIEAGKMELHAVALDANKVITECVGLMQPQASQERVIMRLSLAAALPKIKADERSLRQIVLNLLSNAVKFNEPGGQVIVATARTESGEVVIRIRDTGPGMSDKDIETALEPFRQLSTSRPMTTGTGLGLPLTKALVEANQASFTIRSKVDQGTLVEVAFPAARVLAE